MAPYFSVVISAYNRADMLKSALESIRFQTFGDFECLAVDDGSTDRVPEVIRSFVERDKRFRLLGHGVNRGMNAARNLGVAQAQGKFLTFLDSDDIWLPRRLEAFKRRAEERPEAGFLFSNAFLLRFGRIVGTLFDPARPIPEGVLPGSYAVGESQLPYVTTNVAVTSAFFKKHGGFSAGLKATDTELFARVLAAGHAVAVIREPLSLRRLHENQITAGHAENFRQSVAAFAATGAGAAELAVLRRRVAAEVALDLAKAGRPKEARELLAAELGEAARGTKAWRLSALPGWTLDLLRGARAAYLKARWHPAFLTGEYRAAWEVARPLLEDEARF